MKTGFKNVNLRQRNPALRNIPPAVRTGARGRAAAAPKGTAARRVGGLPPARRA